MNMNTREYLVPICDTVTNPEIPWNEQMSTPTLKQEITCIDASSSNSSHSVYIPEQVQSSACENYYDNKIDVLEQIKKEFPEDNEEFRLIDKEIKRENTDEDTSLDIKKDDYKLEFEINIKAERQEQEEVLYNDGDIKENSDVLGAPQEIEYKFDDKTVKNRVNCKKKERQKRYRERNREKLRKREAERRKLIQHFAILQSNAGPYTYSKIDKIELHKGEKINGNSRSTAGLVGTQRSSIQSEQSKEMNALQRKKQRQLRYRERNREKLKQREAERRRRLQNSEIITESSISSNIEFTKIN